MIFGGIKDCNQDADNAFGVGSVGESLNAVRGDGATSQEGACKVTDGRYDYGEIVAAVPKAVVGCLVTEDLYMALIKILEVQQVGDKLTSMRPTTIDKLGIWSAVILLMYRDIACLY